MIDTILGRPRQAARSAPPPPQMRAPPGLETLNVQWIKVLGKGNFSVVYLVRVHASGGLCALKVFHLASVPSHAVETLSAEPDALRAVGTHPHIVGLSQYVAPVHSPTVVAFPLDFVGGGCLFTAIRRRVTALTAHSPSRLPSHPFPVDVALSVVRQVLTALHHAHSRGVAHRDIKAENILITSPSDPPVAPPSLATARSGGPASAIAGSPLPSLGTFTSGITPPGGSSPRAGAAAIAPMSSDPLGAVLSVSPRDGFLPSPSANGTAVANASGAVGGASGAVAPGGVRVADWGFATAVLHRPRNGSLVRSCNVVCGSFEYVPPEVIRCGLCSVKGCHASAVSGRRARVAVCAQHATKGRCTFSGGCWSDAVYAGAAGGPPRVAQESPSFIAGAEGGANVSGASLGGGAGALCGWHICHECGREKAPADNRCAECKRTAVLCAQTGCKNLAAPSAQLRVEWGPQAPSLGWRAGRCEQHAGRGTCAEAGCIYDAAERWAGQRTPADQSPRLAPSLSARPSAGFTEPTSFCVLHTCSTCLARKGPLDVDCGMHTASEYDPFPADIWALGCTFYEMLCGVTPFRCGSVKEIIAAHETERIPPPHTLSPPAPPIPQEAASLLSQMLSFDPVQRPTASALLSAWPLCDTGFTPVPSAESAVQHHRHHEAARNKTFATAPARGRKKGRRWSGGGGGGVRTVDPRSQSVPPPPPLHSTGVATEPVGGAAGTNLLAENSSPQMATDRARGPTQARNKRRTRRRLRAAWGWVRRQFK